MKFNSVDEYIATFPEETQRLLEEVRAGIKAVAPQAQETISYNIPTFKMNGKYLVYFAGCRMPDEPAVSLQGTATESPDYPSALERDAFHPTCDPDRLTSWRVVISSGGLLQP